MLEQNGQSSNADKKKNNTTSFSDSISMIKEEIRGLNNTQKGKYITFIFIGFIIVVAILSSYFYSIDDEILKVAGDNLLYSKLNQRDEDLSFTKEKDPKSNVEFILEEGGHFEPGVDIYKVGDEYITSDDFNVYFYENYPTTYYRNEDLSGGQIKDARDELIKQSILAQEFASDDENFEDVLNNTRNRGYQQYIDRGTQLDEEVVKRISENAESVEGEAITIWFYNMLPPAMGVDEAKEIAFQKISDLKVQLDRKELDMIGAAEVIISDDSLAPLNPAYQTNAYTTIKASKGMDVFYDPNINDVLYSLEPGEYSEVLTGRDYGIGQEFDAYFTILYVSKVSGNGKTPDALYEEVKSNYEIREL